MYVDIYRRNRRRRDLKAGEIKMDRSIEHMYTNHTQICGDEMENNGTKLQKLKDYYATFN